jgi:hypothetical protein
MTYTPYVTAVVEVGAGVTSTKAVVAGGVGVTGHDSLHQEEHYGLQTQVHCLQKSAREAELNMTASRAYMGARARNVCVAFPKKESATHTYTFL